jgi:23S rRNA (uracil1939-C5)-methyltransferase
MLKKNDEIEVEIQRLGANGEGVAEIDGKVVFVPFALPNEKVLVHIICDKKSFYIAKILKILKPSPIRQTPPCPLFEKCGGCDLQHMPYEMQLDFKKNLIEDTLQKFAGVTLSIEDIVPSPKKLRYRNKFAFPVGETNGEIKIGMFQKNSHRIIPVEDCLLQSETAKKIVKIFKEFMQENHLSGFNEETKTGLVKHIVVRENESSFILTVVVSNNKKINFEPLIQKLKAEFAFFGIYKNINLLNNNVIMGNLDEHVYGLEELEENEFGIKYFVNNKSFLQVNTDIKNLIYEKIVEVLAGEKNIIDAYSGAGLLSSVLTKTGAKVVGVEIVKEATENANKLKKINNLYNLTNKNGNCAKEIPLLSKSFGGDFSVVVDPPRKGVDKQVVEAFLEADPKKIVYLSCNPATLARDLKLLLSKYKIAFIQGYDMFPQTANVETLVVLEKESK